MSSKQQSSDEKTGWQYKDNILHCDGLSLEELRIRLHEIYGHLGSPAFVYSSGVIRNNVRSYKDALQPLGTRGILSYSLKANSNPHLISELRNAGVSALTTVSGNEMLMALKCGFLPEEIIFNGNGKQSWEIEMAVNRGITLNIDSAFDAHQLISISKRLGTKAKTLLRLNPAVEVTTHPYLATAVDNSKFGIEMKQVDEVLRILSTANIDSSEVVAGNLIDLKGVHIHIGSAISEVDVYIKIAKTASKILTQIKNSGWSGASVINLGGGLNIVQEIPRAKQDISDRQEPESGSPEELCNRSKCHINAVSPKQLVEAVLPYLTENEILIVEPGRSLVASAGVVMTEILGMKQNGCKEFIVIDAAMTEVIRPALYDAVHPVSYVTHPSNQEIGKFDIVGPVCESGDFIIKGCHLPRPDISYTDSSVTRLNFSRSRSSALVIWTTGAYCSSMSSNYNLRPKVVEVLVNSLNAFKIIRSPQSFEDLIQNYGV